MSFKKIKALIINRTRYLLSSAVVVLSGKRFYCNRMLRNLKDSCQGKRCFIIGNGPSLTKEDLELLKNEVTFASNRIYRIFERTDWRPTYYAVFDETVGSDPELPRNINALSCKGKFVREQGWHVYRKLKNACYLHTWHNRKFLDCPQFSTELTHGIFTIATVTYTLIQIARYMGFSEIYLIGVDHKYANEMKRDGTVMKNEGVRSYFGNQKNLENSVVAASWEMDIAYQFAESYSRKNGFRIFNATRGGYLEVFERVDLDEVLNK